MEPIYLIIATFALISILAAVFLVIRKKRQKKGISLEQLFKALDQIDKPNDVETKALPPGNSILENATETTVTKKETEKKGFRWDILELVFMIIAVLNGGFLIWFFRKELKPFEFSSISTIIFYVLILLIGYCLYRIVSKLLKGFNP